MFTENDKLDALYRGFNPKFARAVWERRAAERREQQVQEQAKALAEKKAQRERERESVARMRQEAKARAEAEERQRELDRIEAERLKQMPIIMDENSEYKGMTAKEIIATVAVENGMTYNDLVGHSRVPRVVAVRHTAIIEIYRNKPAMSLTQIAEAINRDHTSIISALRKAGVRNNTRPRRAGGTID